MTDFKLTAVGYGSFGTPVYDPGEKRWIFSRRPGRHNSLRILGSPTRLLSGSLDTAKFGSIHQPEPDEREARFRDRQLEDLVNAHTDVSVSKPYIRSAVITSEAVCMALEFDNPFQGDLLSHGRLNFTVSKKGERLEYKLKILAVPGGKSGESLRIAAIRPQRCHLKGDDIEISTQELTGELGLWIGKGSAIRQICIGESPDDSEIGTLCALRLASSTILLKLCYGKRSFSNGPLERVTPQSSRISTERVLAVPFANVNGGEHSHVSFNPWYQEQIAIIDQWGRWQVIDIGEQEVPNSQGTIAVTYKGRIKDEDDSKEESRVSKDGWARILWTKDVNTLIACTRRRIEVIDVKGGTTYCPNVVSEELNSWYLDIRRCDEHRDQVFVLTSAHIFWIQVSSAAGVASAPKKAASILLSVRHFREPRDISLRMRICEDGQDVLILLFSRLSPIISCFRLSRTEDSPPLTIFVADPADIILPIPKTLSNRPVLSSILDVHLKKIDCSKSSSDAGEMGSSSDDSNIRLYDLQILTQDMSLSRLFLACEGDTMLSNDIGAAEFIGTNKVRFGTVADEIEDQIVSNVHASEKPTLDYCSAYRRVAKAELLIAPEISVPGDDTETGNLSEAVKRLEQELNNRTQRLNERLKTLLEDCSPPSRVDDIEAVSTAIERLLLVNQSSKSPGNAVTIRPIDWRFLGSQYGSQLNRTSFLKLCENLESDFVKPLPEKVKARNQHQKEKILEMMAAEICLASARLESAILEDPESLNDAPYDSQPFAQDSSFSLPLLSDQRGQSRASSTIKSFPRPSNPDYGTERKSSEAPEVSSSILYRYAHFNRSLREPRRNTSNALDHWSLGETPSAYSYSAVIGTQQKEAAESQMTVTERRRAARRAEQIRKKQAFEYQKLREMESLAGSQALLGPSQPSALSQTIERLEPAPGFERRLGTISTRPEAMSSIPEVSQMSQATEASQGLFSQDIGTQRLIMSSQLVPGRSQGGTGRRKKRPKTKGF